MLDLAAVAVLQELEAKVKAWRGSNHTEEVSAEFLLHHIVEVQVVDDLSVQNVHDHGEDLRIKLTNKYRFVEIHLEQSEIRISLQGRRQLFAQELFEDADVLRSLQIFGSLHFEQHLDHFMVEGHTTFHIVTVRN